MTPEEHQHRVDDFIAEAMERLERVLTLERQVRDLEDQARILQEEAYERFHRNVSGPADELGQQGSRVSS